MARKYELKRRAERQEETRRRIVEAAIDLHTTTGPARTTLSAIAARAGVQRHTLYAHFPTEADIFEACSGSYMERNPPPDPARWGETADPWERLERGIGELYAWFAANEGMIGNVMRDREVHELTRLSAEQQLGAWFAAVWQALTDGLPAPPPGQALLALALEFSTWRSLSGSGLSPADAAWLMAAAVRCASSPVA